MKRIVLISSLLLVCSLAFPAEKSSIIKDILKDHASQKVEYAQQLIKFTEAQASQLMELEYNFLLEVQKAENSCWSNSVKKTEMLKEKKYKVIKGILSHDEYIKYKAIDNKEIKMHPLWAE